ncbi:MAG: hypothetical protein ACK4PR_00345 [Gammaproteobacteria bacterium]
MTDNLTNTSKQKVLDIIEEASYLIKGYKWKANLLYLFSLITMVVFFFIGCAVLVAIFEPTIWETITPNSLAPSFSPFIALGALMIATFAGLPFIIANWILGLQRAMRTTVNTSPFIIMLKIFPRLLTIVVISLALIFACCGLLLSLPHTTPIATRILLEVVIRITTFLIYLACTFASLLVVTKNLGAIAALKQSFIGVIKNYRLSLGVTITSFLLLIFGGLTIIGWIWTLPLTYVMIGILFRNIYGLGKVEPTTNEDTDLVEIAS